MPGPGRGGNGANEEDAGLVHGATEGHPVGGVDEASVLCIGDIAKSVRAECRIGCLHQCHRIFLQGANSCSQLRGTGADTLPCLILDA